MTSAEYLAPVLQAAELLQLRVHPAHVEQLSRVLDCLGRGYPTDAMPRLEALRALTSGSLGTYEELELLSTLWPDWSGTKRFKLTATTLTWTWSSKHSGRYAEITVPFPTVLPMAVRVLRYADMDEDDNHADECDGDDCCCEAQVEQEVVATVEEWTDQVGVTLAEWLSRAVVEPVDPITITALGVSA